MNALMATDRELAEYDAKLVEIESQRPPTFSDEAIALRFATKHAKDLRYIPAQGRWFHWNGKLWRQDDTLTAFDHVRRVCREASAECNKDKISASLASAKTVAGVEKLAKSDRRIVAIIDEFDADPMVLNTPDGVVDLKTGVMRAHRPEDYLTRITAVAPSGECPLWLAFLNRVTGNDLDLQRFLQRIVGYSLTGLTIEHALFFLFGLGANGKSVFLNTVSRIMGDYAKIAPIETFTASNHDRHPTDVAGLRGARLVTAIETEEGRKWAESRVKSLTGGDKISARFMRQDFFEFTPQFKLVIAGNHKPGLRSVDEAIRRRFNLVPFTVTIPPEERDERLSEKLEAEWQGILRWAVEGCLEWQRIGLAPPAIVSSATADYLAAEDAISGWLDDRCERSPQGWAKSSDLFASWSSWATSNGEAIGSIKALSAKLESKGFEPHRHYKHGRGFNGIRLPDTYYSGFA